MRFKLNTLIIYNATIEAIFEAWERACKEAVSMTYQPMCTSGLDGQHSEKSGHYFGRSADFRTSDIPFELRVNVKNAAQEYLGSDYLVILESTHCHIQLNPGIAPGGRS